MHPFEQPAPRLTQALTRLARPAVRIGARSLPAFVLCVGLGLVAAVLLMFLIAFQTDWRMGWYATAALALVGSVAAIVLGMGLPPGAT